MRELELKPKFPDSLYCFSWPCLNYFSFLGTIYMAKNWKFFRRSRVLSVVCKQISIVTWELWAVSDLGPHPTPRASCTLVVGLDVACGSLRAPVLDWTPRSLPASQNAVLMPCVYCLALWSGSMIGKVWSLSTLGVRELVNSLEARKALVFLDSDKDLLMWVILPFHFLLLYNEKPNDILHTERKKCTSCSPFRSSGTELKLLNGCVVSVLFNPYIILAF